KGKRASWESCWRLVGSKGMISWDGENEPRATVASNEDGLLKGFDTVNVSESINEQETYGHASVISSFLHAIHNGTVPETASVDNINSLAMVIGAIESARLHQRVTIAT